ncbi:MAG: FkbM family methyltransferase, partial [Rickettsiales bacterium]|nr:FkbM family methyltransferase [Rickettsiales bacterium]
SSACFVKINKVYKLEKKNYKINNQIRTKLSIKNDVVRNGNLLFYVPNYPQEMHQRFAVENKEVFTELPSLKQMDKLIPDNAAVLDIGANIGNHTLYWLTTSPKRAKHVYAFEVIDETYEILKKNIALNGLQNKTTLFHFGLGANNTTASISSMNLDNMGATSIQEDKNGKFQIRKLDDVKLNHKIDFVKIDVEGIEIDVIKVAKKFLTKDRPLIWVELWDETGNGDPRFKVGNKAEYNKLMDELGYEMILQLDERNFVYQHKSEIK